MKLYIYQSYLSEVGGVETALYNICLALKDYYDVLVLYDSGAKEQLKRLRKIVDIEQIDWNKKYECDILIRNSVWNRPPENITANKYIEIQHADYMHLKEEGLLESQYQPWDKIQTHVACGEYVGKMYKKATGNDCEVIRNILAPKQETQHIYRFITCSRLTKGKGYERMLQMCQMLKNANIKFQWDIFTDTEIKREYEEMIIHKPTYDIFDYVSNADYTVLLSDSEGLPYTVQESLQYDTPCIVTNVGGSAELIKDKVNGYVVPLDMNFDINIIKKIPKIKDYQGTTAKDWCDLLGGAEYKERKPKEYNYKLRAIVDFTYSKYDTINIIEKGKTKDNWLYINDTFTIKDIDEVEYLCGNNQMGIIACELIGKEEIKETKPAKRKRKEG